MSQNKKGNRYFSASSLLFVARIAGAAAMFGVQIVLARTTSPDTLALYFLATSLVTVAGTVAALGYPYVVIAFMARYHRPRHAEIERAFLAAARRDILMASAIIALGLGAAVALYPHLSFSERLSFLIALPAIPAIALSRSNGAIGRARSRLADAYLPTILWRPLNFLILASLAVVVFHRTDATSFTALFAAIAIGTTAVQSYRLRSSDKPPAAADGRLSRLWRRAALPFIAISIAELLIVDIDTLLAGTVLPRQELAIFAVCLKLAFFGGFIVDVLYELVAPELARCHARRDGAGMQRNIALSNLAAVGSALAMMAGAALLGRTALGFFGSEYVAGYPVLLILIAVQVVQAFGGPHVALLTLKSAQRRVLLAYLGAGAILVVVTVALTPAIGMLGTALALLAAYATLNSILACMVWRTLGLRSDAWSIVRVFIAKRPVGLPYPAR